MFFQGMEQSTNKRSPMSGPTCYLHNGNIQWNGFSSKMSTSDDQLKYWFYPANGLGLSRRLQWPNLRKFDAAWCGRMRESLGTAEINWTTTRQCRFWRSQIRNFATTCRSYHRSLSPWVTDTWNVSWCQQRNQNALRCLSFATVEFGRFVTQFNETFVKFFHGFAGDVTPLCPHVTKFLLIAAALQDGIDICNKIATLNEKLGRELPERLEMYRDRAINHNGLRPRRNKSWPCCKSFPYRQTLDWTASQIKPSNHSSSIKLALLWHQLMDAKQCKLCFSKAASKSTSWSCCSGKAALPKTVISLNLRRRSASSKSRQSGNSAVKFVQISLLKRADARFASN